MERVRYITHNDKQILLVDFTNCTPDDIFDIMEDCLEIVPKQPPKSVLSLSDLTGAQFTRDAVQRMKEVAVYDRPYVKRAAFVGADTLPQVLYDALQRFSLREFPRFHTREEALAYLTAEEDLAAKSA